MLSTNSDTRRRVEALEKGLKEEFEWKTIGRQQAHYSVRCGKNWEQHTSQIEVELWKWMKWKLSLFYL